MEDRAGAAAGGAEGGRDHEDASRKGLAPLWSQSNEERRALRSEYADVRAMIRDGTCAGRFSNLYDDPPLLFSAIVPSCGRGRWSGVRFLMLARV